MIKEKNQSQDNILFDCSEVTNFGSRRLSRILVVQGLYQWLINDSEVHEIISFLKKQFFFVDCDKEFFFETFKKIIFSSDDLKLKFQPYLDVSIARISPVEHSVILLGSFELIERLEISTKIIINEAIEIDKLLGGNQGYKMINGVLDKLAKKIRKNHE